jgi:hypothetical protein
MMAMALSAPLLSAQAAAPGTGSISGRVTSSGGLNVSRLLVIFDRPDGSSVQTARTSEDGSYTMVGLPEGPYHVSVQPPAEGGYMTWYGGTTPQLATTVTLVAGQAVFGIDMDLLRGATISGNVSTPAGYAPDKILLFISNQAPGLGTSSAWTDSEGKFTIKGVRPGSHALHFQSLNTDLLQLSYGYQWSAPYTTPIKVMGSEAITGIDVVMARASMIEGKLSLPAGIPSDGLTVSARAPDGHAARVGTVSPDASYRITGLSPGSYRIKVSAGKSGMVDQWYTAPGGNGTPTSVAVGQEATARGIDMILAKAPTFSDVTDGLAFADDIRWLAARGFTEGFPDNTYRPRETIRRDAMAAFLYRAQGRPEFVPPAQSPFRDITPATQFYKEITWLRSAGITTGYDDGTFRPLAAINRDAMAAFLSRSSFQVSCGWSHTPPTPFTDNPEGGQFAWEINWMLGCGISTGYSDGTYRPTEPVKRDAMAAFLSRWSVSGVAPRAMGPY